MRIAFVLPTFAFHIGQRVAEGIQQGFGNADIRLFSIVGGYLSPKGPRYLNTEYTWIYSEARHLDLDGLIVYTGGLAYRTQPATLPKLFDQWRGIPTVGVGVSFPGIPSIVPDNYRGMYDLTRQVMAFAPTDRVLPAAFFCGPPQNQEATARFEGWADAMASLGLPIDESLVFQGDFTRARGIELVDQILAGDCALPRTIFCVNDLTAAGAIERLTQAGFRVPQDFRVAGFDDYEFVQHLGSGLSTVVNPVFEMGRLAAQQLLAAIDGAKLQEVSTVPCTPVIRDTTRIGPPRKTRKSGADLIGLVAARDMSDRRVLIERSIAMLNTDTDVFKDLEQIIFGAGAYEVHLVRYRQTPDGRKSLLCEQVLPGEHRSLYHDPIEVPPGRVLPEGLEAATNVERWLIIHPLGKQDHQEGYLACLVDPRAAMLPEMLGMQVSSLFERVRMIREAADQQRALDEAREKLQRAEKIASLGRLVAGLAHEMNTPIGTGITLSSFILERISEVELVLPRGSSMTLDRFMDDGRSAAQTLLDSYRRLVEMVENFKSLSYQDVDGEQEFDAADTLQILKSSLFENVEVDHEFEIRSTGSTKILGNPELIDKIFRQLVQNSIQHGYGPEEKVRIQVEFRRLDALTLEIRYRDFGAGVPSEDLAKIFEPFFTTARSRGCIGLGLHIVHNLVTLHLGGTISVENAVGGGLLTILRVAAPAGEKSPKQSAAPDPG